MINPMRAVVRPIRLCCVTEGTRGDKDVLGETQTH